MRSTSFIFGSIVILSLAATVVSGDHSPIRKSRARGGRRKVESLDSSSANNSIGNRDLPRRLNTKKVVKLHYGAGSVEGSKNSKTGKSSNSMIRNSPVGTEMQTQASLGQQNSMINPKYLDGGGKMAKNTKSAKARTSDSEELLEVESEEDIYITKMAKNTKSAKARTSDSEELLEVESEEDIYITNDEDGQAAAAAKNAKGAKSTKSAKNESFVLYEKIETVKTHPRSGIVDKSSVYVYKEEPAEEEDEEEIRTSTSTRIGTPGPQTSSIPIEGNEDEDDYYFVYYDYDDYYDDGDAYY